MLTQVFTFLQETSFHGGRNISNPSQNVSRRIFWVIVLLTSVSFLVYSSVSLVIEVSKTSVQTIYKLEYKDTLEFPTVTICSSCPMDTTNLNDSEMVDSLMWSFSDWKILIVPNELNKSLSAAKLQSLRDEMDIDMKSLFLQIRWNSKHYESESVLVRFSTLDRNCFIFNGKEYQSKNEGFISKIGGFGAGLEIIADVNQNTCPGGLYVTAGLEIYLHSVDDDEPPRSPSALLSPGTATNIGLRRTQISFLPYPYKAIGDSYCTENINYTRTNCLGECIRKEMAYACPCLPTYSKSGTIDFDTVSHGCSSDEIVESIACYGSQISVLTNEVEHGYLCDCPYPCLLTEYDTDISFGYFPTEAISKRLVELGEIPDIDYARKNLLKFRLNYRQLLQDYIQYEPVYNLENIVGTTGGHLGLFLGASIISAIEIIEFLLITCWLKVKQRISGKRKVTKVQPITK